MTTQERYPTVSSPDNSLNLQDVQTYSVVDEQGELIGQVERVLKNESDPIQILFSLPGQSKPLFRVHQKSILKVDLDDHRFFIELTDKMREKLNQYSAHLSENVTEQKKIETVDDSENDDNDDLTNWADESFTKTLDHETIRLLSERLSVKHERRKIGEVIVRKTVETEIVEVPVRREKLIVEQVGSPGKPLAEIDLSQGKITGVELESTKLRPHQVSVKGEFASLKAASDLLQTIALDHSHGCARVRVELVLDNPQHQQQYQELFDRCTNS
ncbi:DUF2382 domain-containing protein [Limnoraphis robusta]|nr:DUF2382 domain-containing protein [Limnoraphis robusta]